MITGLAPFLTFNGQAAEALRFYAEAIPGATVTRCEPYGDQLPGLSPADQQRTMHGELTVGGGSIRFLDMDSGHPAPEFNWSQSIMLDCQTEADFDAAFAGLSAGGSVMMGPASVGDIRKCAWVVDKFGVVWQPVWA